MVDQATDTINPTTTDEPDPEELATIAAAEAAGEMIQDLPIGSVAPDPENPDSRLSPDPEFVSSIKIKQLSPGVVVPLDVWVGHGYDAHTLYLAHAAAAGVDIEPDAKDAASIAKLAEAIENAKATIEYVIVFGHRRWAGAKAAGRDTYRAVVTTDVKDRVAKRIDRIMENVQRANLSPLEEGQEYQRLIKEDGLGQRELTRRTGIPQTKISRRLGLLKLPERAQEMLANKEITVEVANELATFATETKRVKRVLDLIDAMPNKTDEEKEARTRTAKDAAQVEKRAIEAAKAQAKKRAELKKQGIPVIADLTIYFENRPLNRYNYALNTPEKVEEALANGTAVAWVANGGSVDWYTTEEPAAKPTPEAPTAEDPAEDPATPQDPDDPATPQDPDGTDDAAPSEAAATGAPAPAARSRFTAPPEPQETEEQIRAREAREREEHEIRSATMAREVACLRIADKVPNRDLFAARLTRRLLLGEEIEDLDAQKLTIDWLRAAGVIPAEATVYTVFGEKDDTDPTVAKRAAYLFDLALDETRARASGVLDRADVRHIERLIKEAGYEPTPWEQAQMDALTITD